MNKNKLIYAIFMLIFTVNCFAQSKSETNKIEKIPLDSERKIAIATIIKDTSKIISNPGNCPIELLRRLSRAITKQWPDNNFSLQKYGTFFQNEYIGNPNFIKMLPDNKLTKEQQSYCDELIDKYSNSFGKLQSEFSAASESITIKMAVNNEELRKSYRKINEYKNAYDNNSLASIQDSVSLVVDSLKDCFGILSISENGIFARGNAVAKENKFSKAVELKNISIGDYIDDEPLILIAQTHGKNEPEIVIDRLTSSPNFKFIKQIVASAGLDLEKDIIANYAEESLLYINLTPTGEKLIPDIRWVIKIPDIKKLVLLLPKFQNLCYLLGVFIAYEKDSEIIRLTHFMADGLGVYATLYDKFVVLASTKEGANKAVDYLKNISKKSSSENVSDCNLFVRVKTADLNMQLQQFLQSPLMRNQKIPPITNLTFLNDMNNITVKTKITENKLEFSFDMPFVKKSKK